MATALTVYPTDTDTAVDITTNLANLNAAGNYWVWGPNRVLIVHNTSGAPINIVVDNAVACGHSGTAADHDETHACGDAVYTTIDTRSERFKNAGDSNRVNITPAAGGATFQGIVIDYTAGVAS